jgi:hypothetical protein
MAQTINNLGHTDKEIRFTSKVPTSCLGVLMLFGMFISVTVLLLISLLTVIAGFIDSNLSLLEIIAELTNNGFSVVGTLLGSIIICFLLYADFFALDYIFWNFRGYEEVEMNDREITIKNRGKLKEKRIVISLSNIISIQEQDYERKTFFSPPFQTPTGFSNAIGEIGGRIYVIYKEKKEKKIEFGLGLTEDEASIYVKQFNDILHHFEQ